MKFHQIHPPTSTKKTTCLSRNIDSNCSLYTSTSSLRLLCWPVNVQQMQRQVIHWVQKIQVLYSGQGGFAQGQTFLGRSGLNNMQSTGSSIKKWRRTSILHQQWNYSILHAFFLTPTTNSVFRPGHMVFSIINHPEEKHNFLGLGQGLGNTVAKLGHHICGSCTQALVLFVVVEEEEGVTCCQSQDEESLNKKKEPVYIYIYIYTLHVYVNVIWTFGHLWIWTASAYELTYRPKSHKCSSHLCFVKQQHEFLLGVKNGSLEIWKG